jgi:hypothetical protein
MNVQLDEVRSCRKPLEQAVPIARKMWRRPTTGRASLNGRAARSEDDEPEPRFSGLRKSVFETNGPSRACHVHE